MAHTTHRRRNALFLLFFVVGVSMASWITRSPAIRDALSVTLAQMGMVLFGLSVGSMSGILVAGWAVRAHGTRRVAQWGMGCIAAGLFTIALGVGLSSPWMAACGLAGIGAGMGLSEIAINIDGAHIESRLGKPVLHALHGCFSLGATCGALLGMWLTAEAVPVRWHLAAVAVLSLPAMAWGVRQIPDGYGRAAAEADRADQAGPAAATDRPKDSAPLAVWRDPRLLLIGFIVLATAFAEGSASDWLPLLMVDEHGLGQTAGSFTFVVFAGAMTAGRFAGGYFLARFGRVAVLRASALLGAAGVATVILADTQAMAGLAVILWGWGAALGFPVALSAAGDSGPDPAARVRIAATAGYVAFLVGPPLLGFIGEAVGLRNAMWVVLLLLSGAGCAAGAAASPRTAQAARAA